MSLTYLISKLQYLATFVDHPDNIRVAVYSEFQGERNRIKLVDFCDEDDDLLYIVI